MSLQSICQQLAPRYERSDDHLYDIARRVLAGIEASAVQHGRCVIRGFGTFGLRIRAPRTGRNPRTGEPVAIAQRAVLEFRQERRGEEFGACNALPSQIRAAALDSNLGRICLSVAAHYECDPHLVLSIARDVLQSIVALAASSGRCVVRDFGTFHVRRTQPRMARNPRTGAPAEVPARTQLDFKHAANRRHLAQRQLRQA